MTKKTIMYFSLVFTCWWKSSMHPFIHPSIDSAGTSTLFTLRAAVIFCEVYKLSHSNFCHTKLSLWGIIREWASPFKPQFVTSATITNNDRIKGIPGDKEQPSHLLNFVQKFLREMNEQWRLRGEKTHMRTENCRCLASTLIFCVLFLSYIVLLTNLGCDELLWNFINLFDGLVAKPGKIVRNGKKVNWHL